MQYTTLPFHYNGNNFPRLLVKPLKVTEMVTESGVIVPEHENKLCETGTVFSNCDGSDIHSGDSVLYQKIDRQDSDQLDTVSVDGVIYDVIYENEIWSVNEQPVNQIFATPLGEVEIGQEGVLIPDTIRGVTQKGIVFSSPERFGLKTGDRVEYRRGEGIGVYPQVDIDGKIMDVLYERDIFTINGVVAPYRIIVKIDLAAQRIKRSTSESGLLLSPLFIAMLHNLQIGEITAIGTEAAKMYPDLKEGDRAILHHAIEYQAYRILSYEFGARTGQPIFEYRIINCWDEKSREVFGKINIHYTKSGVAKIRNITPINQNIFLLWNFDMLDGDTRDASLLAADNDIFRYRDIDSLKNAIKQKKELAAENAKIKIQGLRFKMSDVNPELDKDKWDLLDSEIRFARRQETELSAYLRRDHLVICKEADGHDYVLAFYEELYPINLLGKKYLIAHPDFVIAKLKKNMNIKIEDIQALNDTVFVLPIAEEKKDTDLIEPDSAKEKPQKGKVVAIDEGKRVKTGDIVLYRKQAGLEQLIGGVMHLILKGNDCLAIVGHSD